MSLLQAAAVLGAFVPGIAAVNNGLARTPQMGWNNWNSLGCDVSESLLLDTAQQLVDSGLRDVGYNYVVLDDCWSAGRGADGYLNIDTEKFPNGMNSVSDEIHKLGLLYGMYSSAGEMTCARYAGSLDWEEQDAKSFAGWGVDYLKYDNCYHMGRFGTPLVTFNRYKVMWDALNSTGRPILYSLCNWGEDYSHTWGMSISNSWRVSGDIYDSFTRPDDLCTCTDAASPHCIAPGSHCSVLNILNRVAPYVDRGQPGGWNDLDMLEVGNGGMTDDEYVAHFSIWAALKSPLLMGNDLRTLSASALTILNNPAVIAINQDPEGRSAARVRRDFDVKKDKYGIGEVQIWSGPLSGGDQVVLFLNAADENLEIESSLAEIFVHDGAEGSAPQTKEPWDVYDLWANRMDEKTAQKLLDAPKEKFEAIFNHVNWYNSTAVPYKEGLKNGDERLYGKKVRKIDANGVLSAKVKRHAVKLFRLKSTKGGGKRYSVYVKEEL
ncbi:glycoside hydrolase family 27 protein [Phlyctema vagabunda]|uniref:Alpha-galactosidase n=1 Tax=Phlyctema vagabunda TaxID=108571 RepID=A0ABR4P2M1_9HELO